jgi:hypothetical protein
MAAARRAWIAGGGNYFGEHKISPLALKVYDLRFTIAKKPRRGIKSALARESGGADLPVCCVALQACSAELATRQRRPTIRSAAGRLFQSSIVNRQL